MVPYLSPIKLSHMYLFLINNSDLIAVADKVFFVADQQSYFLLAYVS